MTLFSNKHSVPGRKITKTGSGIGAVSRNSTEGSPYVPINGSNVLLLDIYDLIKRVFNNFMINFKISKDFKREIKPLMKQLKKGNVESIYDVSVSIMDIICRILFPEYGIIIAPGDIKYSRDDAVLLVFGKYNYSVLKSAENNNDKAESARILKNMKEYVESIFISGEYRDYLGTTIAMTLCITFANDVLDEVYQKKNTKIVVKSGTQKLFVLVLQCAITEFICPLLNRNVKFWDLMGNNRTPGTDEDYQRYLSKFSLILKYIQPSDGDDHRIFNQINMNIDGKYFNQLIFCAEKGYLASARVLCEEFGFDPQRKVMRQIGGGFCTATTEAQANVKEYFKTLEIAKKARKLKPTSEARLIAAKRTKQETISKWAQHYLGRSDAFGTFRYHNDVKFEGYLPMTTVSSAGDVSQKEAGELMNKLYEYLIEPALIDHTPFSGELWSMIFDFNMKDKENHDLAIKQCITTLRSIRRALEYCFGMSKAMKMENNWYKEWLQTFFIDDTYKHCDVTLIVGKLVTYVEQDHSSSKNFKTVRKILDNLKQKIKTKKLSIFVARFSMRSQIVSPLPVTCFFFFLSFPFTP